MNKKPPRRMISYTDKVPGSGRAAGMYSENQRMQAIRIWLAKGTLRAIEREMKIPYVTLQQWKASKWWPELLEEVRRESLSKKKKQLEKISDKALQQLEDRLDNGDHIVDVKKGGVIRKPVGARDLSAINKDISDINEVITEKIEAPNRSVQEEAATEVLKRLAEDFMKFAKAKQVEQQPEAIDAEVLQGDDTNEQTVQPA